MKRISIFVVVLLAIFVAACTGEQASPTAEESEPIASPTAESTPEPAESTDPGATPGALPSGFPDLACDDSEIADLIPDSVGGQPLQVLCMAGDQFAAAGGSDPAFQEFLDSVDAEPGDLSVAFGGSADQSVAVVVFRVAGVPEDALEESFLAANQAQGDIADAQQETIGGKDVWSATSTDPSTPGSAYIYVKDDTVYFLTGTPENAEEILETLP